MCHTFFVWHPPVVVKHHVIHRSRRNNHLRWMSSDRTNITLLIVGIFTGYKSWFESSAVEAMQSILKHEFSPNLLLDTGSMTPPNSYDTSQESSRQKSVYTPSSWIHHGVESHVLEDESINAVSSARLSSRSCSPKFCPLDGFLYINGLLSRMQSVKDCCCCCCPTAAPAAFEEAGIFPLCGGNGFPMHARRFVLRFNVVRILWRLGRFEASLRNFEP